MLNQGAQADKHHRDPNQGYGNTTPTKEPRMVFVAEPTDAHERATQARKEARKEKSVEAMTD